MMTFYAAIVVVVVYLCSGCVGIRHQTGAQKTAQEPLHAETGVGVTIWKIPIIGFGGWGSNIDGGVSSVIVHKYDYQVRPPALAPGTPPTPPWMPSAVDYKTVYESSWDDPTLVIFKNDSYRKVRVEIDGHQPIVLAPYGATTDLHLGMGEHRVRITIEKPTAAHGTWELVRFFPISIRPEGRSQIFYLYDY